jgi:hypothetical protein
MKALILLAALAVGDREPIQTVIGPIKTMIGDKNIFADYSVKSALDSQPILPLPAGAVEALAEVNEYRARFGLRPFVYDEALTLAAARCASVRAANRITGHHNDYAYLPAGARADATGCGWAPPGHHWLTCCTEENWRNAGAAFVQGADGYRYMHLFVSNQPSLDVRESAFNPVDCPPGKD